MVAGVGGPTATESIAKSTPSVEEREKRREGEEEKNFSPLPLTPHSSLQDDDDEEVSWQNAARASLEKNKPLNVKAPPTLIAKKVESAPSPQKFLPETESPSPVTSKNTSEATNKPIIQKETPSSPLPSSAPLASPATPQPQSSEDLPPIEAQFTREELPTDFWSSAAESPTNSYDDELFETATSSPTTQTGAAQTRPQRPAASLPFDMPLFNELQGLFPGKILRIDMKQQKQTEESEESTTPTNEAVNVVESED